MSLSVHMCAYVWLHAGPESATAADELPLPLEYLAVHKELVLAYRLLEAHSLKVGVVGCGCWWGWWFNHQVGGLRFINTLRVSIAPCPTASACMPNAGLCGTKSTTWLRRLLRLCQYCRVTALPLLPTCADRCMQPGDCCMINAANSIVGRTLLQLCKLLKLRTVAVVRCRPSGGSGGGGAAAADLHAASSRFAATAEQLKALGATLVLKDEGSIKVGTHLGYSPCVVASTHDCCVVPAAVQRWC